ncbi:SAM-dependent methyltransferase, partial [Thermodesulfobacteriota bacterium]
EEYPEMRNIESTLSAIRRAGYSVIGHFVLPESAWWRHYYTPLEKKLVALREDYKDNPEALVMIELHEREIDLFRKYSDYYGYVFYVTQG